MKEGIPLALVLALALDPTARPTDEDNTRSTGSPSPTIESPTAGTEAPPTSEAVAITPLDVGKEAVELEVPYDPQRIAILDMTLLDTLDALGMAGSHVVGSTDTFLNYLRSYVTDRNVANLGTIKTADLKTIIAAQPDVIFIGGRLVESYDVLSEIVPVVYPATDSELGMMESVRQNTAVIAPMFDLEDKMNELMAGLDTRIQTLTGFVVGKTAIVGMCTSGGFNVLGSGGRCSTTGREIGFENIDMDVDAGASTHGSEASFGFVMEKNPDYIFVMDRGAIIQIDGVQLAREIMESELVMGTDTYKNNNIVYLTHPAAWYTAEGGTTALSIILQGLESRPLG